jgi:hypothetical protein
MPPVKKGRRLIEANQRRRVSKQQPVCSISKFFDEEANCSDDSESEDDEEDEEDNVDDSDYDSCEVNDGENAETNNQTVQSTSVKDAKKKRVRHTGLTTCKKPGDTTLPINSFSLTIAKVKDDVPFDLLQNLFDQFICKYCIKGAIATETGVRIGNLHIQGVLHLHCPTSGPTFKLMSKFFTSISNQHLTHLNN